jgi:hypothetical protein
MIAPARRHHANMRRSVGPLRRALLALGLLAALMLLLQPVCKAYEGQHKADSGLACCLDMQLDAVAAAPSVGGEKPILSGFAALPSLPGIAPAPAQVSGRLAKWKHPPAPSPSYYARSTRIQR